jgi:hypothetical protein
MVRRPSPAVFRSPDLDRLLKTQDPDSKLRRWLEDMENVLMENMYAGDMIRKNQIPSYYTRKYGVNALFRYAHPEGYRSCYTILNYAKLGLCPYIFDMLSHEEYERIFGYRKR